MTVPIWMALPPEVHSTLLSSGVGAGTLLAAADAWNAVSSEYTTAAAELATILGIVQGGSWEGHAAARYLGAHAPYLSWLAQAGANSAGAAAQLEAAAGAYHAALATMPTLAELAANRATLSVLVATNFFGVNTIPIAVTEADYLRMWLQAATTMSLYQAVSAATVASTPRTAPAPAVLAPGVGESASAASTDPIEQWLSGSEHFSSMYQMLKQLLADPIGTLYQVVIDFAADPAAAATTWLPLFYLVAYGATFGVLGTPIYAAMMGPAASAAIPIALGLSGLAAMAETPAASAPTVVGAPGQEYPAAVVPAPPSAAASAPPASSPPSVSAAPAPPVPAPAMTTGTTVLYYAVSGGGPGVGFGPSMQHRAAAAARTPSTAREEVGADALATTGRKSAARRRRSAAVKAHGYRYEFITMDDDTSAPPPPEEPAAIRVSGSGSVTTGSTGTTAKFGLAGPAGLTTLTEDAFGNGASAPMMPGSWTNENATADRNPQGTD